MDCPETHSVPLDSRPVGKNVTARFYASEEFAHMRSGSGVTKRAYRKAILESGPYVLFQSNSKGAARSGGIFFSTSDGKYMIKTIKSDEVHALLCMLPTYFDFMARQKSPTLLTRFYSLVEVSLHRSPTEKAIRVTFLVMNSVFPDGISESLSERFDLKGSTRGRICLQKDIDAKGPKAILKDKNLINEFEILTSVSNSLKNVGIEAGLQVGPSVKAKLLSQLRKDLDLLVKANVMDYSLLIGVEGGQDHQPGARELLTFERSIAEEQFWKKDKRFAWLIAAATFPIRGLSFFFFVSVRRALSFARRGLSLRSPYYGAKRSNDVSAFSSLRGKRRGRPVKLYFGLIDFLQPFNNKKYLEWRWKALTLKDGFSCVPPREYADRLLAFIDNYIF